MSPRVATSRHPARPTEPRRPPTPAVIMDSAVITAGMGQARARRRRVVSPRAMNSRAMKIMAAPMT